MQSSKFITQKKSRELIHKLEKLVSVYEAKQLQRQVVVTNRNKTINENIYYNIDMIYNGISGDVKIRFQSMQSTMRFLKIRRSSSSITSGM